MHASNWHAITQIPPPCPKCGKKPAIIGQRVVSAGDGLLAIRHNAPKEMIYTFQCSCGATFAQTVLDSNVQMDTIGAATLTRSERESVWPTAL